MVTVFQDLPGDRVGDLAGSTSTSGHDWAAQGSGLAPVFTTGGGEIIHSTGTYGLVDTVDTFPFSLEGAVEVSWEVKFSGGPDNRALVEWSTPAADQGFYFFADPFPGSSTVSFGARVMDRSNVAMGTTVEITDTDWHTVFARAVRGPDGDTYDYRVEFDGVVVAEATGELSSPPVGITSGGEIRLQCRTGPSEPDGPVSVRNLLVVTDAAVPGGPSCWRPV